MAQISYNSYPQPYPSTTLRRLSPYPATQTDIQTAVAVSSQGLAWLDDQGHLLDPQSIPPLVGMETPASLYNTGGFSSYNASPSYIVYTDAEQNKWVYNPVDKTVQLYARGPGAGYYANGPLYQTYTMSPTYTMAPVKREPLSVKQRDHAFMAYKTLKIVVDDGALRLLAYNGIRYPTDGHAVCSIFKGSEQPTAHKSPMETCACGFYGLKKKPLQWEYGAFRAQVEMFGRVIRGENGYRAERQRVLSMEAQRVCVICQGTAVGFSTGKDGLVLAMCKKHAILGVATPSDLTGQLGTQVSWAVKKAA